MQLNWNYQDFIWIFFIFGGTIFLSHWVIQIYLKLKIWLTPKKSKFQLELEAEAADQNLSIYAQDGSKIEHSKVDGKIEIAQISAEER